MSRTIPTPLVLHMQQAATTTCFLLKVTPLTAPVFGLTTLDQDVVFDDGSGTGPITYRAARGYTASDQQSTADLAVDNAEAAGLLAEYPIDGMTMDGINQGAYDNAPFVQYIVNYMDLTQGATIANSGTVGQVSTTDGLDVSIELRSLTQTLKQKSVIELVSITCRAAFGDERCKMPLVWHTGTVIAVGAEPDREFSVAEFSPAISDGTATAPITGAQFFIADGIAYTAQLLDSAGNAVTSGFTVAGTYLNGAGIPTDKYTVIPTGFWTYTGDFPPAAGTVGTWSGTYTPQPEGYFAPGILQWLTGANAGLECEVDSNTATDVTLLIPANVDIAPGDTFRIRQDCDKSKARCRSYGNLLNMRAEPDCPRGSGTDLQSPTPSS